MVDGKALEAGRSAGDGKSDLAADEVLFLIENSGRSDKFGQ
jgi:hypothetical protein